MNYLSVCSGIEAATVAWKNLGWNAIGFSEIEPFPCAVLKHHYPNVINYGDINGHSEWNIQTIDILAGGTPCQSFSIAGLRKGLEDPRGNIMLVYLGIIASRRPRWIVWENVPGVLSSNGGRDFGTFLAALGNMGYEWAYRVLDAQWFGLAQRRKRVFVIGCLGDRTSASKVLFESESVCRDLEKGREKREKLTRKSEGSIGEIGIDKPKNAMTDCATVGALCADSHPGAYSGQDAYTGRLIAAYAFDSLSSNSMKSSNPVSGCNQTDISKTLDTSRGLDPSCNQGGIAIAYGIPGNWIGRKPENGGNATEPMNDISPCLTKTDRHGVANFSAVRRLTPIECERLQGFPDKYTEISWKGKPLEECPDGPRYKALGNSMAVPVMRWIGERIAMFDSSSK